MKKNETKKMEKWDFELLAKSPWMDVTAYRARNLTLRGAASLARALLARWPGLVMGEAKAAFGTLGDGYRAATDVLARVDEESAGTQEPRNTVLAAYTSVASMLDTLAASPAKVKAAKATQVRRRTFGGTRSIARLTPWEAWTAVDTVRKRLDEVPGLRKQLEALVSAELVTALLDANALLGVRMGVTEDGMLPEPVDGRHVITYLVRCIDHYAVCVAATATPGDVMAVQRAERALKPILTVRAALSRRRARGEVVEETDLDGLDDDEAEPAPEPASESEAEVTVTPAVTSSDG